MLALVLMVMLSMQDGGTITGVLQTEAGTAAAKVRVAARLASPAFPAVFVSLAETDENGRFVLRDVPPGLYFVVAGRVDAPTVYPGTQDMLKGAAVTVTAGATISSIDFVIAASSYRPADPSPAGPRLISMTLPVTVTVEGGANVPEEARIQLIAVGNGQIREVPLTSAGIDMSLPLGVVEEYRVRIANLPSGYVVKSISFRSTDLASETLKASPANLRQIPPLQIVTFGGDGELQRIVDEGMQRLADKRKLSITLALSSRP